MAELYRSLRRDRSGPYTCRRLVRLEERQRRRRAIHASSATPTLLFKTHTNNTVLLSGLDLSAITGTILDNASAPPANCKIANCKIASGVTFTQAPLNQGGGPVDVIACDNGTKNYRNERHNYMGDLTTETTIVRTAGASDGTTAFSWKIITTANVKKQVFPFETFEGAIWNDTTGSAKTLTVHFVTDNVTLNDDEIWLEVEYPGSSATPVSYRLDDMAATILTTPAAQTSDSGEAWTTTGLTTPVKQKTSATFTPQMKGLVRWRLKFAKASTTVYVCPKADLT
jgi:hypothetical protein